MRHGTALSPGGADEVPPRPGVAGLPGAPPLSRGAGHLQLPGQPGGAGRRLVQPVDPAHPVCLHVLPPRPVRRVLRLAVAAGARRPQLERCPHRPGASACALPGQAAAGRGGVRPGHGPHRPALSPQRQAGRYLRPPAPGAARLAGLRRPGLYGGVRRTALPQSGHPRLRPAGSHRPGGWNLRPAPYQPGLRRRLSLLPALPGYAGQQPPDGPAPPLLSGGLRVLPSALLSAGRTAAARMPPGKHTRVPYVLRAKRSFRRQEGL